MKICNKFSPKGFFTVEHRDKDGKLKGKYILPNGVTNEGKNNILDVAFHADTQITAWFVGLINNAGFSALAASDVMNSHAGWTEFTDYTEGNRVAWPEDAASSESITNSTSADFNITGAGTLNGVFLVSEDTKGGTTGVLWATASFSSPIPVVNTDLLKITYTVNAT